MFTQSNQSSDKNVQLSNSSQGSYQETTFYISRGKYGSSMHLPSAQRRYLIVIEYTSDLLLRITEKHFSSVRDGIYDIYS